uniref:Uncharacterized protein n=1 Tax=Cercocebus atys TaxID=9531 RepID=A0A2K5KKX5_CERAT
FQPCETWSIEPTETPHSCCSAWPSLRSFVTQCVETDISTSRMEILVVSDVSCVPEATASPPFSPESWRHPRHPLTAGLGDCGELHPNLPLPFPCPRAGQADEVPPPEPPAGPGSQSPLQNGAWFIAPVRLPHLS